MNIRELLAPSKPKTRRIRISNPIGLTLADGTNRGADAGEEVEVTEAVFRQLDPCDYIDLSPAGKRDVITDPSPARPSPAPLPPRWDELPKCFTEWHTISEAFRVAAEHIGLIRNTRIAIFGTNQDFSGGQGTILAGAISFAGPSNPRDKNIYSGVRALDLDDPATRQLDRFLNIALASAEAHLDELRNRKSIPLQRAFLEAGTFLMNKTEAYQELADEVGTIGFQLFSKRVAALGLHEYHVRRLYQGSADWGKYGCLPQALTDGAAFGGMDDDGRMFTYCDLPVPQIGSYALLTLDRIAIAKPLLVEAQRELKLANKADS